MTKVDFIKAVANKAGFTQKDTRALFDAQNEVIADALKNGEEVTPIDGLKLYVKDVDARTCRNPQTGEAIVAPAHKAVKAKVLSTMKNLLKD